MVFSNKIHNIIFHAQPGKSTMNNILVKTIHLICNQPALAWFFSQWPFDLPSHVNIFVGLHSICSYINTHYNSELKNQSRNGGCIFPLACFGYSLILKFLKRSWNHKLSFTSFVTCSISWQIRSYHYQGYYNNIQEFSQTEAEVDEVYAIWLSSLCRCLKILLAKL